MSNAITLADILKSAPTVQSPSASILTASATGALEKVSPKAILSYACAPGNPVVENLNEMKTAGFYLLSGSSNPVGAPPGRWYTGFLEVFDRYGVIIWQRITGRDCSTAIRAFIDDAWSDWKIFATQA